MFFAYGSEFSDKLPQNIVFVVLVIPNKVRNAKDIIKTFVFVRFNSTTFQLTLNIFASSFFSLKKDSISNLFFY